MAPQRVTVPLAQHAPVLHTLEGSIGPPALLRQLAVNRCCVGSNRVSASRKGIVILVGSPVKPPSASMRAEAAELEQALRVPGDSPTGQQPAAGVVQDAAPPPP